jgi:ribosomal protein L7/L12
MKLSSTLRSWVGRYGSEAAFVGRVALAAFLPPGCSQLLSHGLEAACEYLQGKSDVVGDRELVERLDELEIPQEQLSQAVNQIESQGQTALDRVHQARLQGIPEGQLTTQLRDLISTDPTLLALQQSMGAIADQLRRLESQGETLIAGQQYQTAAIEEMMAMMREIASQVGVSVAATQSMTPLPTLPAPAERISTSTVSTPQVATDALSMLGQRATPSESRPLSGDALSMLGQSSSKQSPVQDQGFDALQSLGSRSTEETRSRHEAQNLVERFLQQRQAREGATQVDRTEAVALVERFKSQLAARANAQKNPSSITHASHVGDGRVSLVMIEVGSAPVQVVKYLCETWGYSLQDAIISTQSVPITIRRDQQFVLLERQRQALEKLGARVKLKV